MLGTLYDQFSPLKYDLSSATARADGYDAPTKAPQFAQNLVVSSISFPQLEQNVKLPHSSCKYLADVLDRTNVAKVPKAE